MKQLQHMSEKLLAIVHYAMMALIAQAVLRVEVLVPTMEE